MSSNGAVDVLLVGRHAGVVGESFESTWAHVRVREPDDVGRARADIAMILDRDLDPRRFRAARRVVWNPDPPAVERRALVVARPWPVADGVFGVEPSPRHDVCLVLAPEGTAADAVVRRLGEHGLRVHVAPTVTREMLAEATLVVSLGQMLPPEAFAILAARRVLVARAGGHTFGLQPWVDFVPYENEDELVLAADMLAACPECWAQMRALSRQSAEPHRTARALRRVVRRVTETAV